MVEPDVNEEEAVSFPSEFPQAAVSTVIKMVQTQTVNKAQLALALYEIEGYVLHQVFGDTKYMMGSLANVDWAKLFEYLKSPEVRENLAAFAEAALMFSVGTPVWRIAIKISFKYGPKALLVIKKLLDIVKG
jgi:hypothetical protein